MSENSRIYSRFSSIFIIFMLVLSLFGLLIDLSPSAKAQPDFSNFDKRVNMPQAYPGDYLDYTINFTNDGSGHASNVWINDTLPDHMTYISDTANTLTTIHNSTSINGRTLNFLFNSVLNWSFNFFTITVEINATAPDGAILTNNATIEYTDDTGSWMDIHYSEATTIVIAPKIVAVKTVDRSFANPGDHLNYTIYVNNTGSGVASNINITDTLPQNVIYLGDTATGCNLDYYPPRSYSYTCPDLGPSDKFNFTIFTKIATYASDDESLSNFIAILYSTPGGPYLPPTFDSTTTKVRAPRIQLENFADKSTAGPGEFINYTVSFRNNGNGTASHVWINNTLPQSTSYVSDDNGSIGGIKTGDHNWTFLNVGPGDHHFKITAQVISFAQNGTSLDNYVYLEYTDINGNYIEELTTNTSSTVISIPSITFDIIANRSTATSADMLNFTIFFNNTGNGNATQIWINNTLPPYTKYISDSNGSIGGTRTGDYNWTFTDVEPGNHYFNIEVQVQSALNGTQLVNAATLEYTDANGNYKGRQDAQTEVLYQSIPSMTLEMVADKTMATKNEIINYTIYFNNTGFGFAPLAWINVTLPQGLNFLDSKLPFDYFDGTSHSWNFTDLSPGQYSLWLRAVVESSVPNGKVLITNATLEYTDENLVLALAIVKSASVTIGKPLWTFNKVASSAVVHPGDTITYTIYFENTGLLVAPYVWINDTFTHLIYLNDTAADSCQYFSASSVSGNRLYFVFENVPTTACSFNVTFRVSDNVQNDLTIINEVRLEFTDTIFNPYAPILYWNVDVTSYRPIIYAEITADKAQAKVRDEVNYTIRFDNIGGSNATTVWVNMTAPGLTYIDDDNYTVTNVGSADSPEPWSWVFTDVMPGEHDFSVHATVDAIFYDDDLLFAEVAIDYSYNSVQFSTVNNLTIVTIRGQPQMDFVVLTDEPDSSPDVVLPYNVHFNNLGNAVASRVWINLSMPTDLQFVGDTSASVAGVSSTDRPAIGYWVFEGVTVGGHMFTVYAKGEHELGDGTSLDSYFTVDYTDRYDADYETIQTSIRTEFKRPVLSISVRASEMSPEPGDMITFEVQLSNNGSVEAGEVRVNILTSGSLHYVGDDADTLNGVKTGEFSFVFTNIQKGIHTFNVTTTVAFESKESFINATFVANYTDPSGSVKWKTNKTVVLTLNIPLPPMEAQEPLNAFPILIAVIAMLGAASLFLSENTKYGFFLLFLPLYTKLKKKNILEHETRGLIRGYIIANPGDHFNSIKKALNLNNGTLAYHLHVLEREGLLKSRRWGKFTRFYPSGMKIPENGSRYSEIQKLIISKIKETPGISQKEIAAIMGVTKPTVNYHMGRLIESGIVEGRRLGIQVRYFLKAQSEKPDT